MKQTSISYSRPVCQELTEEEVYALIQEHIKPYIEEYVRFLKAPNEQELATFHIKYPSLEEW